MRGDHLIELGGVLVEQVDLVAPAAHQDSQ